jgi:hypothetical protein
MTPIKNIRLGSSFFSLQKRIQTAAIDTPGTGIYSFGTTNTGFRE